MNRVMNRSDRPFAAPAAPSADRRPNHLRRPGDARPNGRPKPPKYRKLVLVDPESLAQSLETRQQLSPDQPLADAVRKIADDVGVDEAGVERVLGWTTEQKPKTVGELRRIDRMKLAREMYRLWRQGASAMALS